MANLPELDALTDSADRTHWPAYHGTTSNSRRGDSLSTAEIDAEIRWFFESSAEPEPLRP